MDGRERADARSFGLCKRHQVQAAKAAAVHSARARARPILGKDGVEVAGETES